MVDAMVGCRSVVGGRVTSFGGKSRLGRRLAFSHLNSFFLEFWRELLGGLLALAGDPAAADGPCFQHNHFHFQPWTKLTSIMPSRAPPMRQVPLPPPSSTTTHRILILLFRTAVLTFCLCDAFPKLFEPKSKRVARLTAELAALEAERLSKIVVVFGYEVSTCLRRVIDLSPPLYYIYLHCTISH